MAPSSGHLLVPKAMRAVRFAVEKTCSVLRTTFPRTFRPAQSELQPALARNRPRHPIHPVAYLRQSKARFHSLRQAADTTVRQFSSSAKPGVKYDRSAFPRSRTGTAVNSLTHRAPFATTLRPNLTGGTLSRTAGGYSLGAGRVGGARYFSHTPAAPAQVINNVSAAVRAFWLSGQKARFDGVDPRSGEKRFKSVTALQEDTHRKIRSVSRATPGSNVDFAINPTITALSGLTQGFPPPALEKEQTLNTPGVIDILSVDFARALKELAAVTTDLKRLSALGDLPLTMLDRSTIRVHFPGCDAQTVERLCDEVGVQRGIVRQDADFDDAVGTETALLFPFAPSTSPSEGDCTYNQPRDIYPDSRQVDWQNTMSPERTLTSPGFSNHSDTGLDLDELDIVEENPWLPSSPSGYESMHSSEGSGEEYYFREPAPSAQHSASAYEGLEGIYRFLEQCDSSRH